MVRPRGSPLSGPGAGSAPRPRPGRPGRPGYRDDRGCRLGRMQALAPSRLFERRGVATRSEEPGSDRLFGGQLGFSVPSCETRFRSRDEDDEEREAQEVDGELGGHSHSYLGVGLGALAPESSRRVRGPGGPGAVHGVWWTPSILAKPGTEGEERCLGLGHRASMFPL